MMSKAPPKNSVAEAMNPQKTGKEVLRPDPLPFDIASDGGGLRECEERKFNEPAVFGAEDGGIVGTIKCCSSERGILEIVEKRCLVRD